MATQYVIQIHHGDQWKTAHRSQNADSIGAIYSDLILNQTNKKIRLLESIGAGQNGKLKWRIKDSHEGTVRASEAFKQPIPSAAIPGNVKEPVSSRPSLRDIAEEYPLNTFTFLIFTSLTGGLYYFFWMYLKWQRLCEFARDESLQIWKLNLASILFVVGFLFMGMIEEDPTDIGAVLVFSFLALTMLLVSGIMWLILLFRIRKAMDVEIKRETRGLYSVNPVLTFIFQSMYLNYVLNKYRSLKPRAVS